MLAVVGVCSAPHRWWLISWICLAFIGWVIFFFVFRTESDLGPED